MLFRVCNRRIGSRSQTLTIMVLLFWNDPILSMCLTKLHPKKKDRYSIYSEFGLGCVGTIPPLHMDTRLLLM